MKYANFLLVCMYFQWTSALIFKWKNAAFWAKDIPKGEFKNYVEVRLVKNDWMPSLDDSPVPIPPGDEILEKYEGSVEDAEKIFKTETNMYHYHQKPLVDALELLTDATNGYKREKESIFIIHTISGDGNNAFVKNVITALVLRNIMKKFNVFALHMPDLQDSMEQTIVKTMYGRKANFQYLGGAIGDVLNDAIAKQLMYIDKIHLIGFCYSSQLSGYIGRYLALKNGNQKIKSITALDPYSAFFSGVRNRVLSKSDAQLVYAYHSNSILYGSLYRRATADFNFNSGWVQPKCVSFKSSTGPLCSHRMAVNAFWYVILFPQKWVARRCSNYLFFRTCLCNRKPVSAMTFPPVPGASGTYFVRTMKHKPYGFGPAGADCLPLRNPDPRKGLPLLDFNFLASGRF